VLFVVVKENEATKIVQIYGYYYLFSNK